MRKVMRDEYFSLEWLQTTFDFPCEEEEGLFHHHSHRENGSHYHKRNQ